MSRWSGLWLVALLMVCSAALAEEAAKPQTPTLEQVIADAGLRLAMGVIATTAATCEEVAR